MSERAVGQSHEDTLGVFEGNTGRPAEVAVGRKRDCLGELLGSIGERADDRAARRAPARCRRSSLRRGPDRSRRHVRRAAPGATESARVAGSPTASTTTSYSSPRAGPVASAPEPGGGGEPALRRVDHRDVAGAEPAGDEQAEQADRAGSDDADPGCRERRARGAARARRWPVARPWPPPPSRRRRAARATRRPAPPPARRTHPGDARRSGRARGTPPEAAAAQVAVTAAEQRVDGHAATGRVDADDLVAHHQRRLAEPEAAEAVQLAAADARPHRRRRSRRRRRGAGSSTSCISTTLGAVKTRARTCHLDHGWNPTVRPRR